MEKELQKIKPSRNQVEKQNALYDEAVAKRPMKTDLTALQTLSFQLEKIATDIGVSVIELLERAEHSKEFKEEYLEARKLACQIALLKK